MNCCSCNGAVLKQSWEEFRAVVPPYYSIKLKREKQNNLPVIFVCEFLNTKELVAAYGNHERQGRERIGDEDEFAEINFISSRK